jgi:D-alanyl-D-alanine carboxypeptidase
MEVKMNTKISKLQAERKKNLSKISELQARNKKIDGQISELENTDIVGLVRENGLTPEMLAQIIKAMQKKPLPVENAPSRGGNTNERSDTHEEN